jgi:hypothetical protein
VVLVHRHGSDEWRERTQTIESVFRGLGAGGPVIVKCGHEHQPLVAPFHDEQILLVRGVPAVDGASRPGMRLPSLHQVMLLREAGAVAGANVCRFELSSTGWLTSRDNPKRYAWKNRRWART